MLNHKPVIYKGKVYYWVLLTYEECRYLYYGEWLSDEKIAKMFGVSVYAFKMKRRGYGLSKKNYRIEEAERVRKAMAEDDDVKYFNIYNRLEIKGWY